MALGEPRRGGVRAGLELPAWAAELLVTLGVELVRSIVAEVRRRRQGNRPQ